MLEEDGMECADNCLKEEKQAEAEDPCSFTVYFPPKAKKRRRVGKSMCARDPAGVEWNLLQTHGTIKGKVDLTYSRAGNPVKWLKVYEERANKGGGPRDAQTCARPRGPPASE